MIDSPGHRSGIDHLLAQLEPLLYRGGWPFRLARALVIRPRVRTTRYLIPLSPGLSRARSLTIAYASDFHAGPATNPTLLRAACAALQTAGADVLLLGGDFVTLGPSEIDWLAHELGQFSAPLGRFAVLGTMTGGPTLPTCSAAGGSRNSGVDQPQCRLDPPFDGIWICGLDDHCCGRPDLFAALAGAKGVLMVLMHAPSGLLDLAEAPFNLALCGHTLGGQLALPGGIPVVVPSGRLSRRYSRGHYEVGAGRARLSV